MRQLFTFILLFLAHTCYSQNTLRQITFVNMLPHTEYVVTVNLDGRKHWAQIPPAKSGKGAVHFPVYEWTKEIVVSVSPAWESDDKVFTPKGGHVGQMDCVEYYSPHVWRIKPKCWTETCMTFYLNNEKMPRP